MTCVVNFDSTLTRTEIRKLVLCDIGPPQVYYKTGVPWYTSGACSNPQESRPYPESLIDSVTGQSVQWRGNATRMKFVKYLSNVTSPYCGRVKAENYDFGLVQLANIYAPSTYITTNWQLKARLQIKDEALNLGASLAEYRESSKMFLDMARGVHNAIKVARGKSRRKHKFTTCDIADTNILNNFGVQPLVSDFAESFKRLSGALERPLRRRFVVTAKNGDKLNLSAGFTARLCSEMKRSDRMIVYVTFNNPDQFTLGNPLELMWELTPYSFVVDWMIPVGDYLSSLDALKDVKDIKGTLTTKFKYDGEYEALSYSNTVENGHLFYEAQVRTVLTTIPFPEVPKYEPSKSLKAVWNGLSLLHQTSDHCTKRGARTL